MKTTDFKQIDTDSLQKLPAPSDGGPLRIDVRGKSDYDHAHLPEARHNSVYEIGFEDRMTTLAPDQAVAVCVYGHGPDTQEARMAAEKLVRAGYTEVLQLRDGLDGWKAAGLQVEGTGESPTVAPSVPDGRREIDLGESRVEWVGRNLLNRHRGTVALKSGYLDFQNGLPVGGEFVFDMHVMACENLAGDALHDVLIDHLRSHDFFDSAVYPEARFRAEKITPLEGAAPGAPNLRVDGELTLKDRTLPLGFDAVAGFTPEGKPAAQAAIAFDRTQWNALYGSGRFFRNLGMHLVNDLIELQLRILTK